MGSVCLSLSIKGFLASPPPFHVPRRGCRMLDFFFFFFIKRHFYKLAACCFTWTAAPCTSSVLGSSSLRRPARVAAQDVLPRVTCSPTCCDTNRLTVTLCRVSHTSGGGGEGAADLQERADFVKNVNLLFSGANLP